MTAAAIVVATSETALKLPNIAHIIWTALCLLSDTQRFLLIFSDLFVFKKIAKNPIFKGSVNPSRTLESCNPDFSATPNNPFSSMQHFIHADCWRLVTKWLGYGESRNLYFSTSMHHFIPPECWGVVMEWLGYGDASSVRLVSKLFYNVVKVSILDDQKTLVSNPAKWLTCFPSAISMKVSTSTFATTDFPLKNLTHLKNFEVQYDGRRTSLAHLSSIQNVSLTMFKFCSLRLHLAGLDGDLILFDSFFSTLEGIKDLQLSGCINLRTITDTAFSHLKGIRKLWLGNLFENRNLTAASMASLAGIESLSLNGLCQVTITDSFFKPLSGIKSLHFIDSDFNITDAALHYIKGVEFLLLGVKGSDSLGLSQITRKGILSLAGIKFITLFRSRVKTCELSEMFKDYDVTSDYSGFFYDAKLKSLM